MKGIEDYPLKKPDIKLWFLTCTGDCELYLDMVLWDANIKLASQFIN